MPDSHVKFHSTNGKRLILTVEDDQNDRRALTAILEEKYEILTAVTAGEAMKVISARSDILSLVLMDLTLPDANGLDLLRNLKANRMYRELPVIVLTGDKDAEVESLSIGAIDFLSKPYPPDEVVLARVRRTIELSEDREILHSTERDHLTGLYNQDFFYRYAEQYDSYHREQAMDAIVVDVNHFHMINERYGKTYGDAVLTRIGERVRDIVRVAGGIVCRHEADTFYIYCPHRSDYTTILENATMGLTDEDHGRTHVRLRMGVYAEVDKSIDIERRFDRAKLASNTVRSNFTKAIAIYDSALHESELFEEHLLESFHDALKNRQFQVYYQPKFDIRPVEPLLNSAEALVRWMNPELGMISPSVFVPLFEKNGLIRELDNYVWNEVAKQLREWKTRLGFTTPVSVNVSRVDMYDEDFVDNMKALIEKYGVTTDEFLLEITESAYTEDSDQIVDIVRDLRKEGFKIEMDDFGVGYSSLNMISTLPIDALKLDMHFIRSAFSGRKDTRMLEVILEIADSLMVPSIAEGVETAEQMFTLKAMGCDVVQGFYFSRPIPAMDYEAFLLARKQTVRDGDVLNVFDFKEKNARENPLRFTHDRFTYEAMHDPLTGLYNQSAFNMLLRDADKNHIAVLVADMDDFSSKESDRAMGDLLLRRAAGVLRNSFRSVDFVCRIYGDEFAVIMTRVDSSLRELIFRKVDLINRALSASVGDIPPATLSFGVAFADRNDPDGDIYQDARKMLNDLRRNRQRGCKVY